MTIRDKIGLVVLVGILVALFVTLVSVLRGPSGPTHRPEDSPIIKQRIINIQKMR